MNKKVIISILVGVIVIGGIAYASTLRKTPVTNPSVVETTAATPLTSVSTSTNANQSQPIATATTPSKDCGTDMNCFIAQASTCGPATATNSITIGTKIFTAKLSVSKATTTNMCSFTDSAYGTKQSCTVSGNQLSAIVTRWKAGEFSSSDFAAYKCTTTSSDGTSFTTSTDSNGAAVSTHGYTYSFDYGVGAKGNMELFSYEVLAVGNNSMTLSFTNNNTKQTGTVTAKINVPAVFAGYTFTVNSIDQYNQASFDIKSN